MYQFESRKRLCTQQKSVKLISLSLIEKKQNPEFRLPRASIPDKIYLYLYFTLSFYTFLKISFPQH